MAEAEGEGRTSRARKRGSDVHSEVARDKNYHDYHANDVEDIHFVSSDRGTVAF